MKPSELSQRLGIPAAADALDVLRGRRGLTETEAGAAAALLRLDPAQLGGPPPIPRGLVIELQRPRWRNAIRDEAAHLRGSEHDARALVARDVMPMAARTTGPRRGEPDWAQLVGDRLRPK